MLLLAFRSFFFIAVLLGYSTGIWRLINDYFRREFQSYLQEEVKTNQYLLQDPPGSRAKGSRPSPVPTGTQPPQSPPLLEETIARVGQALVADGSRINENQGEVAAAEQPPANRPNPDEQQQQQILTASSSEEEVEDEETRWLHYWKQRSDRAAAAAVKAGKSKEFAAQHEKEKEEEEVCAVRESDAAPVNSNLMMCPG
ncbi:uncharacterized protein LOC125954093 [Anopheles darlingi]|uniref:uncharacterized protein LOC125954093 n=1 Tax=Anopheles darlingi TaxID=43151 RepID=UPI0021005B66|nr:uncharacterized protein LOC125954093 [Anopheles darlingi]